MFDVFTVSDAVYVCPYVAHFALDHGVSIVGLNAARAVHGPLFVFFFPGRLGRVSCVSHGLFPLRLRLAEAAHASHTRVARDVVSDAPHAAAGSRTPPFSFVSPFPFGSGILEGDTRVGTPIQRGRETGVVRLGGEGEKGGRKRNRTRPGKTRS